MTDLRSLSLLESIAVAEQIDVAIASNAQPGTSNELPVDDGSVEVGGDDLIEIVGDEIFEDVDTLLDSEEGRDELGTLIDGQEPEERSPSEAAAIEQTLDDLDDADAFEVEVIAVDAGTVDTIQTAEGTLAEVYLSESEGTDLVIAGDELVLLVDEDLTTEEVIEEVVDVNTTTITGVAENNGVLVDLDALRSHLRLRAETVYEHWLFVNILDGTTRSINETINSDVPRRIGEPPRS
ncbi:MAG: hypothetical protein AAF416_04680 [Pseudomonadota bacterium]